MTSGIYRIRNLVDGHYYIGSSVNIEWRWKGHLEGLRLGKHRNRHLQRAFDKYGEPNFIFEVIEETKDRILREQFYLDTFHPNYNISPTAGSNVGTIHPAESWARHSAVHKGKIRSAETRAKISAVQKGKVLSPETCQKMSVARKGKPLSEAKLRAIEAQKGKTRSPEIGAKISAAKKGKTHSSEAQLRADEGRKGKPKSAETCQKMSIAAKARDPETRFNLGAASKGNHWSAARRSAQESRKKT